MYVVYSREDRREDVNVKKSRPYVMTESETRERDPDCSEGRGARGCRSRHRVGRGGMEARVLAPCPNDYMVNIPICI